MGPNRKSDTCLRVISEPLQRKFPPNEETIIAKKQRRSLQYSMDLITEAKPLKLYTETQRDFPCRKKSSRIAADYKRWLNNLLGY